MENMCNEGSFSFTHVSLDDVTKQIKLLCKSKSSSKDTIPPQMIKENCDILSQRLQADFNVSINNSTFPDNMKFSDVTPAHTRVTVQINQTRDLSVYFRVSLKYLKNSYSLK